MTDYDLLRSLCTAFGPSGFEEQVANIIMNVLKSEDIEFNKDNIGNIFVEIGEGKPVTLITAHMDEIGFIVTHITESGFLRMTNLGGVRTSSLPGVLVDVKSPESVVTGIIGSLPPHISKGEAKEPSIDELYVDIGASSKEEVLGLGIRKGSPIVFKSLYLEDNVKVISKALDDRLGCFVLIEALKRLSRNPEGRIIVGFTVQEEVGCRGASALAHKFKPDIGISIEGTIANDTIGTPEEKVITRTRKGVAMRLMDATIIANNELVRKIIALAEENNINYQLQISPRSGTDAKWYITLGSLVTGISIPVRYIHSPYSMAFKSDIEDTIKLLSLILNRNLLS
ncbi:M42 family peptidase [Candidatus Woesearchaeota archaeon]|nr:MAG: M42 family peptidase [Candidatus Woesearchaeota archaeon]